jgi:hypothetical protein
MRWKAQFLVLLVLALQTRAALGQSPELLLFGGSDHKTFLGCLNCKRFDSGSVCNRYGDSGSRFNANSIWNRFGEYGSRFSSLSPWNKFASDPPVVVDRQGGFYGYFTAAIYHPERTKIKAFLAFLDDDDEVNEDLEAARNRFCGD